VYIVESCACFVGPAGFHCASYHAYLAAVTVLAWISIVNVDVDQPNPIESM